MIKINSKAIDILKSATFNAISCLCNNLIYLVILHSMAFNQNNASLNQNGLSVALCIVEITFGPIIQAFSNGLKILYSQYFATMNIQSQDNNKLLFQSIMFCSCLAFSLLIVISFTFEYVLRLLNYDEEIIQMTQIGIIYLYIGRIILISYEFTRSQLQGLKVFGPFAIIQSISFGITAFICILIQINYCVGIHQAGFLTILHEIFKIGLLFIYIQKEKQKSQSEELVNLLTNTTSSPHSQNTYTFDYFWEEKQTLMDLLLYIKPLLITLYIEFVFFNVTVILSGRYSKDYIVPAVCFQMTNGLIFKGVLGIVESTVSFCGTSLARRDFEGSKEYFRYALTILLSYETIFIIGLISFSENWARCFSIEPEIISNIHFYKYLYLITVPIDGTQIIFAAFLQVCEIKNFVAKISLLSYISTGIPLMFILGDVFNLKLGGIWLAIGIANSMNLAFYIKKIQMIDFEEQYKIIFKNQDLNCIKTSSKQKIFELCEINNV